MHHFGYRTPLNKPLKPPCIQDIDMHEDVDERLNAARSEAKCCIPLQSTVFILFHSVQAWLCFNWLKCFLVIFVWSIHFVEPVFSHQTIGKCTSLVIKQTDSIVLATFGNLKCYACDQQCCIFLSVLYGNSSALIR